MSDTEQGLRRTDKDALSRLRLNEGDGLVDARACLEEAARLMGKVPDLAQKAIADLRFRDPAFLPLAEPRIAVAGHDAVDPVANKGRDDEESGAEPPDPGQVFADPQHRPGMGMDFVPFDKDDARSPVIFPAQTPKQLLAGLRLQ